MRGWKGVYTLWAELDLRGNAGETANEFLLSVLSPSALRREVSARTRPGYRDLGVSICSEAKFVLERWNTGRYSKI